MGRHENDVIFVSITFAENDEENKTGKEIFLSLLK
jgi:hypothetical protein